MKYFSIFIFSALFVCASPADAFLVAGGSATTPPSSCPHSAGGFADGCAGANQSAQIIFPNFFTDVRQSSQGTYKTNGAVTSAYPVGWDACGVTYPCGQISADGSLTASSAIAVSGCSYVTGPPAYVQCNENGADKTISGYYFNDVAFFSEMTTHKITFTNNHFKVGFNNCRGHGGEALVIFDFGTASAVATNNTWDTDETVCSFIANIFGQSDDPGLTVNSTGTAGFVGTCMTYTAGPTSQNGTPGISVGQYIHYTGQTDNTTNDTTSSLGSAPKIIGHTCNSGNGYDLDTSQTNSSGKTVTTGPQLADIFGAIGIKEIGYGTLTATYNAVLDYSDSWVQTSGGSTDLEFNFARIHGHPANHVNYIQQQPAPCDPGGAANACAVIVPIAYEKFNTIWWPSVAAESGTTTLGYFTTSFTANTTAATGYQVTYADMNISNNIAVSNTTTNSTGIGKPPGPTTATLIRTDNQYGSASATYTGSAVGGVLTVSGVSGTIAIGDYIRTSTFNNTSPLKIISGSGTTWGLNQAVTFGAETLRDYLYNGVVTSFTANQNALDNTGTFGGAGGAFTLDPNSTITSQTISGNWNLLTGAACSPSSC